MLQFSKDRDFFVRVMDLIKLQINGLKSHSSLLMQTITKSTVVV